MAQSKIKLQLSPESIKLIKNLREASDRARVYQQVVRIFSRESLLGAGFITRNYLSGQRLNRITGTLARSVVGVGGMERGVPIMKIGVLSGPALSYAGILEVGTTDYNPESPYSMDKNGRILKGRRPRFYLRDGFSLTIPKVERSLEEYFLSITR
jgi:hypothetical protein